MDYPLIWLWNISDCPGIVWVVIRSGFFVMSMNRIQTCHTRRPATDMDKNYLFWLQFRSDPPENCHLNVKKLTKTWHFLQKIAKMFLFFLKNCKWQFTGGSGLDKYVSVRAEMTPWYTWQFVLKRFLLSSDCMEVKWKMSIRKWKHECRGRNS